MRVEPELADLKHQAEQLAEQRRHPLCSVHLLAAIAAQSNAAADLLIERHLDTDSILRRSPKPEPPTTVRRVLERARELGANMGQPTTSVSHVLLALMNDRQTAAHQLVAEAGIDLGRLRSAVINVALGVVGRRRIVGQRVVARVDERGAAPATPASPSRANAHRGVAAERTEAPRAKKPTGVAIPLIPPERARTLPRRPNQQPPLKPEPPSSTAEEAIPPSKPRPEDPTSTPARVTPRPTVPPRRAPAGHPKGSRFTLDPKRHQLLVSLGRNLTLAAERGELDPVIGREIEIEHTLDVLAKRHANNPVLVGRSGVGKTAVVRGLAQHIAGAMPTGSLDDRIVVEIPIAELVAGTGVRGALAGKLAALRQEVASTQGRVVLFFDEIHELFSGDATEELQVDLKLLLARGELPCIGTSNLDDFSRVIGADTALARRFTMVEVDEPSTTDAFLILEAMSQRLAEHHQIRYSEEALALAVKWSVRYLSGRALPDKAVAIADLAGARARRRGEPEVESEVIAEVVAQLADMPVERLLETDVDRMIELEQRVAERVVGHAEQITRIARILRRNTAGLGGHRPLGSFLLLGPTGVGKTETAKAVAEVLFHDPNAMTRIDLAEYGEQHAVARLIGAPPGYVGHEAGGQLTEAVRRRPYQVVLLDEIEKAHPDVLLSFLAVLDEGRLTDGRGRTVDFTNTVLLMTSNIGADVSGARRSRRVGFGASDVPADADVERDVTAAARAKLAPELYNRIDEVLVFSPLTRADVTRIAQRLLDQLGRRLQEQRGVQLVSDDNAVEALLDAGGFDPTLGARPMKRVIARHVEAPLADQLLRGELSAGDLALLTVEDGELSIDVVTGGAEQGTAAE